MAAGGQGISTDSQRQLVGRMRQLVQDCSKRKHDLESHYADETQNCSEQHDQEHEQLSADFQRDNEAVEAEYSQHLTDARLRYETDLDALTEKEVLRSEGATGSWKKAVSDAKYDWFLARRQCQRDQESERLLAVQSHQRLKRQYAEHGEGLERLDQRVNELAQRRRCRWLQPDGVSPPPLPSDVSHLDRFVQRSKWVSDSVLHLRRRPASRFLDEGWVILVFLFTFFLCLYPAYVVWGWRIAPWLLTCALAALVVSVAAHFTSFWLALGQVRSALPQLAEALGEARDSLDQALQEDRQAAKLQLADLRTRYEQKLAELDQHWQVTIDQLNEQHETERQEVAERFSQRRAKTSRKWNQQVQSLRGKYVPLIESGKRDFEARLKELDFTRQQTLQRLEHEYQKRWTTLSSQWVEGLESSQQAIDRMNEYCEQRFPDLRQVDWTSWTPPTDALPALRFGQILVDLEQFGGNLPRDERLPVEETIFRIPAVLSYPEAPSLLFEASGPGRTVATDAIQNVMLRLLTSLPAGKVRLTIIDPTGLGQNFSAFMHLADFDERLVSNRIWTETTHINQRLADLTEHMENVIQKYLRNEYRSIQQYNQYAGEIAEPFQVLVVANFPTNFSEETARRLVSIATSGPRCGVFTLISVDTKMKLPRNFDLTDLKTQANTLQWDGQRFHWEYDELKEHTLDLDMPPEEEVVTAALRCVGEYAKDANRVEVPFAAVAPREGKWWTKDSRDEVEVALGRVGATKHQSLHLGRGTSQHVLIAGKTGSGKSTLLHAMITNLALHYSPEQVQFYLVDFKKGVEFKPYAQFALPHARVIAIESEREFGMSVLERLDVELRRRGDLFRRCGVQGLAGYREAQPDQTLPRLLLVIDEFQEFFVKDDKLAQDASLLLDRLVRQGRAFGIHVLLGSQTLAGTYTLSRSTIGQMAVRIALQCSSADAHLILSEDNDAARLLHRPGEAIYNDANGLFEGNKPFQVVWLPDHEKEAYLHQLQDLAKQQALLIERPVVFEGNAPAEPSDNPLVHKALEAPAPQEPPLAPRAWLGEAIAITDPPAAVFQRRSGSNLLIVGQREEAALGILTNSLLGLAAFSPADLPRQTRFYVFDGVRLETNDSGLWKRLAKRIPLDIQIVTPRQANEIVAEIAAEVDARLQANHDTGPAVFLIAHHLARFRTLKKSDDDFGFGLDSSAPPSPAAHLAKILREGPALGVHSLIWCDTYNNTTRWLDRQTMFDLDMRVLFQMSATDSSNLMDSPEASHMGPHRAVFYSEEQGQFERFRPYRCPTPSWLRTVAEHLQQRDADRALEAKDRNSPKKQPRSRPD